MEIGNFDKNGGRQRAEGPKEKAGEINWGQFDPLFPRLNTYAVRALEVLPEILHEVWPLGHSHRASLPDDIVELSAILTHERALLKHSYWERPGFVSAYLYYFFPWNIIRQCRLFQGLFLHVQADAQRKIIIDGGAGCLALPIALWLSRADLRAADIKIISFDRARRPLELGKRIYNALAEKLRERAWPVTAIKCSLENAAREIGRKNEKVWLVTAANLLNEFVSKKMKKRQFTAEEFAAEEEEAEANFEIFLTAVEPFLNEGAYFLAIEPGTRLGGSALMGLRSLALERNFSVISPCTHQNPCPLLVRNRKRHADRASLGNAWCHFTFDVHGAPAWLRKLSAQAGLDKKSLSLSLLMLSAKDQGSKAKSGLLPCRILSQPFVIPGLSRFCRYGCEKGGLAVLPDAANLPSGALLPISIPDKPEIDKKSGAVIARP